MTKKNFKNNTSFSREQQIISARCIWSLEQARPEQIPPEDESWTTYVYIAGRGAGKTRTAAEWICQQAIFNAKARYAVIAPTMQDVIQTCVEGESGILAILERYRIKYLFIRSHSKIILQNSSQIFLYSAEEPNRLRGPQFHGAWLDELASFAYPDELYDTLLPSLRLGKRPQHIITTTPKSIPLLKALVRKESQDKLVVRGSTFDNSNNLPSSFILSLKERFDGTRHGRQELYGELLDETDGAIFHQRIIDKFRYSKDAPTPTCIRKVLAIDPAVSWDENSAETGMIVAGISIDGHYWVIEDGTLKGPPIVWATKAIELYKKYRCDNILVEANNGGSYVVQSLQQIDPTVATKKVHASTSKEERFSSLSIKYEQGVVHHIGQLFELEEQMTSWVPYLRSKLLDRLDALSWSIDELEEESGLMLYFASISKICKSCWYPNLRTNTRCSYCLVNL